METGGWTYIGLGSNVGDRGRFLRRGVEEIRSWAEVADLQCSGVYESAHVGAGPPQRDYWNLCLRARIELEAHRLLDRTQDLERAAGRRSDTHGEPRELDIDLLVHGAVRVRDPRLRIPHPGLEKRRFVLEPLRELDMSLRLPSGRSLEEALAEAAVHSQRLRRLGTFDGLVDLEMGARS